MRLEGAPETQSRDGRCAGAAACCFWFGCCQTGQGHDGKRVLPGPCDNKLLSTKNRIFTRGLSEPARPIYHSNLRFLPRAPQRAPRWPCGLHKSCCPSNGVFTAPSSPCCLISTSLQERKPRSTSHTTLSLPAVSSSFLFSFFFFPPLFFFFPYAHDTY